MLELRVVGCLPSFVVHRHDLGEVRRVGNLGKL